MHAETVEYAYELRNSGHSLCLRSDGSIAAWGENDIGRCNVPAPNSGFTAVDAGLMHNLGLKGTAAATTWYLAEGATMCGMETWILVQNPGFRPVKVDIDLYTAEGPLTPPELQGLTVPAESRSTFNLGPYAQTYETSILVTSYGGEMVCERAMYGNGRTWAHVSVGFSR